ncbi:MAG: tetratricopeptide repeat protein [Lysobacteraceae bacterium]|nr:MAG: tetratricopeptide repeat protein [Xanthomonadaceae bacterium]
MSIEQRLREISALQQTGAWPLAEQKLRAMVEEFPSEPDVHRTLALQASANGRHDLALLHMTTASQLAPDSIEFGFQLGCLQAHTGQYGDAIAHFRKTVAHQPGRADAWYFLGTSLLRLHRDIEALAALRTARGLAPGHVKILRALADLEFRAGYPADALPLWQELLGIYPDDVDACLKTGETMSRLGLHDQAIASYETALERMPHAADLWMALAQSREDNDDRKAALAAYQQALVLKPGWAFPLSGMLGLQRGKAPDSLVEESASLQASAALPDADRALIGYELGKVHDGRGDYQAAMASWDDANAARRRMIGEPDLERLSASVDRNIRLFQPAFFQGQRLAGSDDPRMVFIVGMPRSGTTLTEQIIASHPQAHGCGELPDISLIVRNLPLRLGSQRAWPESVLGMDQGTLAEAIMRYREAATRNAHPQATRLVDKAPLNFFHLGLVAMMFPRARVIWCRRDPRDVAVSIYGENFALEEKLATSFAGIGHYINLQQRLMRHWQESLPLPVFESRYENLVSSPEEEARKIIDFVGLPWDPACLDFHLSSRGVQTPSRWQVKQPMHTRSVGRWRNYEASLAPLLDVLDPETF